MYRQKRKLQVIYCTVYKGQATVKTVYLQINMLFEKYIKHQGHKKE